MQHKTEEEPYIFCIKIPTTGNIKRGGPDFQEIQDTKFKARK